MHSLIFHQTSGLVSLVTGFSAKYCVTSSTAAPCSSHVVIPLGLTVRQKLSSFLGAAGVTCSSSGHLFHLSESCSLSQLHQVGFHGSSAEKSAGKLINSILSKNSNTLMLLSLLQAGLSQLP